MGRIVPTKWDDMFPLGGKICSRSGKICSRIGTICSHSSSSKYIKLAYSESSGVITALNLGMFSIAS